MYFKMYLIAILFKNICERDSFNLLGIWAAFQKLPHCDFNMIYCLLEFTLKSIQRFIQFDSPFYRFPKLSHTVLHTVSMR
jgi:hypothetical protein